MPWTFRRLLSVFVATVIAVAVAVPDCFAAQATTPAAPWRTALSFSLHPPGWRTGQSGTIYEAVGRSHSQVPFSIAWAANVRCPDCAISDPPNATLQELPRDGIIVWAEIAPASVTSPGNRRVTTNYSLTGAYRFACCEGEHVAGGERELYGLGPGRAYGVLVRVYFGAPATTAITAAAQRVLDALRLPGPRS
jgi:hypothetical protein